MYYAFHGIRANSNRHDAILRNLPYLGIALVGIGSAVFHSTMKNYTQWCKLDPSILHLSILFSGIQMARSLGPLYKRALSGSIARRT